MPGLSPDDAGPPIRGALIGLDANALQPAGTDRDGLIDRFRDLVRAGVLRAVVLEGVGRELADPRTPPQARLGKPDASLDQPNACLGEPNRLAPSRRAPTAAQHIARIRVRAILRGDAMNARHDADAAHLCDAAEAGCDYFLTHDKRFARKRGDLEAALPGLRVIGLRELFDRFDARPA